jgi:hypothetical protein
MTFGSQFDQPVDHLPKTLTSLTFGDKFNQPVNDLPSGFWFTRNIAIIAFGNNFNQPLGSLPRTLTSLRLPEKHDCMIALNDLPSTLNNIIYGYKMICLDNLRKLTNK